jgi:hypothetical protein
VDSCILLLSDHESVVDRTTVEEGEIIQSGMSISFTCPKAIVGDKISIDHKHAFENVSAPALDFEKGWTFEKSIWDKFGHPVNFFEGPRRREFLLVISFGRAKFHLNVHTVDVVLQACFGGNASLFRVQLLR